MPLERKEITIGYPRQRTKRAKICFPGGVVTVTTGLRDAEGRRVVAVSVTADNFAGEPENKCAWGEHLTARGGGVRIIQEK